jgi:outer membrane protein TolC
VSSRFVTPCVVAALALGVLGCSSGASVRRPIARTSSQTPAPSFVASEQSAGSTSDAAGTETAQSVGLPIAPEPTPDRAIQTVQHSYPVEPEANPPEPPAALVGQAGIEQLPPANGEPAGRAIDLPTALSIAAGQNPQVAFAGARVREAFAQLDRADALWLPSINAGVNYNKHEGRIQDVRGEVFDTSRGALFSGLGAQAVGAGSPAVPGVVARFHLSDAVFQPRIAESFAAAQRHFSRAAVNDVLLATSLAYLELLVAAQERAIVAETLQNAQQLAELTASYATSGQGTQADADRAQAELALRKIEMARTEEAVQVASVRLARQLSEDPIVLFAPAEPSVVPIDMIALDASTQELVATGLSCRPELAESRWLVQEAVDRLNRERHAPLLPSVLLGASYGGFGGGLGSDVENFGDRFDIDAAAFWEIRNLGHGEAGARDAARARIDQARYRQIQLMDQVAGEVAEAHTQVLARRGQLATAVDGIRAAGGSYEKNLQRIKDGQGLPLEVLQSLQALDQSRRQYLRAVAGYNEAQFRLQRALGWAISDSHASRAK